MADIKTKDVIKGTIKTLDRAAIATDRVKHAYVTTKDKAEQAVRTDESSGGEYASNKASAGLSAGTRRGVQTFDKIGRESTKTTIDNVKKTAKFTKEKVAKTKQNVENFKHKRAEQSLKRQSGKAPNQSIRTAKEVEKNIKQSVRSTGNKTIKRGIKAPAKTTRRYLKTAEKTSKTTIKTTEQSAKVVKNTAKTSAKAAQRAARATKKAAETTAKGVKAATKATIQAVKAIIASTKALITAIIAGGWVAVVIVVICVLLGAAVSLFGGGTENSGYTPVSQEVEAYTPTITKYAKQYGIPEYVELIKAVMMQESGGRGNDPMQAAEGAFNTRYPKQPNGIQDPDYSIQCGVQELKAALNSAGVKNPIDMENIKLALQGYNFGNGYITWAKKNYGGYSYANAVEFSTNQAKKLGWDSYGDTLYVSHVLRYYPYGRAFTSGGNQAIIEVALSQLGNKGGQPYWSWYGFNSRVEWCACFVSWCADQSEYIEQGIIPKYSLCSDGVNWFKKNKQWEDRNATPPTGAIIFFDWGNDGTIDHTGLVEKCENGKVYTVEGNSGDMCRQREYAVGSSVIYGYGIPAY